MNNDIVARYEQAQMFMQGIMTKSVVMNDAVFPHWIEESHCFWYIRETKNGKEFRLVNAESASNILAFNHKALAEILTTTTGKNIDFQDLPIENVTIISSPLQICFQALDTNWLWEPETQELQKVELSSNTEENLYSPDGKKSAFIREHNIWIRNQATGEEQALTHDGIADYCYGHSELSNKVQALWSPNSKLLFTIQLDTREVASRPRIFYAPQSPPHIHHAPQGGGLHPQLTQAKMAHPGDKYVPTYKLIAIDTSTGRLQAADYNHLPFVSVGMGFFTDEHLGWWSPDNRRAYFIDVTRGAKTARVVEFDTHTGFTRVLFEETSDTFVKLNQSAADLPMFLPLPSSEELIWFSERTDWGHLYLYNLNTGELKHQITGVSSSGDNGEWLVRNILHYDIERREILLQTAARDQSISPYYRDICKVNIDSGALTPLVSGCFEHLVYQPHSLAVSGRNMFGLDSIDVNGVSPSGEYLVSTRSRVDTAPVSILIDRDGREILSLEISDVSGLPSNWHWPEPVKLKVADDQTDIYGVVYRPPGFSPDKLYPVLDFSNGLRYLDSVPQGSFVNGPNYSYNYLMGAAFAALGFIVVAIEGRGTPLRNKTFQDHNYGDTASTSDFTDRIAGLRQLAKRYPYMDLERVGITGMDMIADSVYGLLIHPDFYKVGVEQCFHEPRFTHASIGETYSGISVDKMATPKVRHAEEYVESLKGKLLLIQGMLDHFTSSSTFRLVQALQQANKDFDMLCLPNESCDVPNYAIRRTWDYLVTHLQGIEPPREFHLTTSRDYLFY